MGGNSDVKGGRGRERERERETLFELVEGVISLKCSKASAARPSGKGRIFRTYVFRQVLRDFVFGQYMTTLLEAQLPNSRKTLQLHFFLAE